MTMWLYKVAMLVGRSREQAVLREALDSPDAELVAVYGRRRIGKTYLVRHFFGPAVAFELTGTHDGSLVAQLEAFATAEQFLGLAEIVKITGK